MSQPAIEWEPDWEEADQPFTNPSIIHPVSTNPTLEEFVFPLTLPPLVKAWMELVEHLEKDLQLPRTPGLFRILTREYRRLSDTYLYDPGTDNVARLRAFLDRIPISQIRYRIRGCEAQMEQEKLRRDFLSLMATKS